MRARSFRTRRAAVLVAAGAVCAVAITVGAQGTARPLWTFTSEQDIASYGLINSGDLFVSTKTEFFVLDGSTGDVVWKTTDFENCVSDGRDLECRYLGRHAWQILFPGTTYVRTYFDERVVIHDLTSGEKVFDSIDHEIGKVISHRAVPEAGQLLLHTQRGNDHAVSGVRLGSPSALWTVAVSITKDFRWLGELRDGTALIYGKEPRGARVVAAIDLNAGQMLWSKSDLLQKDLASEGVPAPFQDESGGLVLFLSKDGPMKLDPRGEVVWKASGLEGKNPTALVQAGDTLFVQQGGKLFGVRASDGSVLWSHDPHGALYGFEVHPRGLFVWSQKNEVNLIDRATGKPLWQQPARLPKGWSPAWYSLLEPYYSSAQAVALDDNDAFVAGQSELIRIDLVDGSINTIARYDFGDGQAPARLEENDRALVLYSSQNVARFERDGRLLFHRYHRASRMGGLARLTELAVAAAFTPPYATSIAAGSGRYERSLMSDRFFYMYFEDPNGDEAHKHGLVRIDKVTGDETEPLWINERVPGYVVNPMAQSVYYRKGRQLFAVGLPES